MCFRQIQEKKAVKKTEIRMLSYGTIFSFIKGQNFVNLPRHSKFYVIFKQFCKKIIRGNVPCQKNIKNNLKYILNSQHNYSDYSVVLIWVIYL